MDFSRRDSLDERSVLMLGAAGVKSRRRGSVLGRGVTLRGLRSHPRLPADPWLRTRDGKAIFCGRRIFLWAQPGEGVSVLS